MAAILKTFLAAAICIAPIVTCFDMTIGDYEVAERSLEVRSIEERKDANDMPWTKMTVAFKKFDTPSPLFKQCTNDDWTVDVQFAYLSGVPGGVNKTMTKFVQTSTDTEPTYTSISASDFYDCAKKAVASTENYKQLQAWTACGFLCWSHYTMCRAATTTYNVTEGHKCTDDTNAGVLIIH